MDIVRSTAERRISNREPIVELRGFCILCTDAIDDFVVVSVAQVDFVWGDSYDRACMLMSAMSLDSPAELPTNWITILCVHFPNSFVVCTGTAEPIVTLIEICRTRYLGARNSMKWVLIEVVDHVIHERRDAEEGKQT